jgi:hypothetical protein
MRPGILFAWADCVDGCFVCPDGWADMFVCSWAKAPGEN